MSKRKSSFTASSTRSHNARRRVPCNCPECNGQLVDPRTKTIHEATYIDYVERQDHQDQEHQGSQDTVSAEFHQLEIGEPSSNSSRIVQTSEDVELHQEDVDDVELHQEDVDDVGLHQEDVENVEIYQDENDVELHIEDDDFDDDFNFLRVRKNRPKFIMRILDNGTGPDDGGDDGDDSDDDDDDDDEPSESSEFTTEEDIHSDESGEMDDNVENFEIFEDYSPPEYEPFPESSDSELPIDDRFLWILLWIMNFRTRFNIPETATEALIKFMKLVLSEVGGADFNKFPDSLYSTKKVLGLNDQFYSFVPCSKCHKLYQKNEVANFQQEGNLAIMKCRHVEFPNSILNRSRLCNTPLSQKINVSTNNIIIRPNLIYPFSGIKQQLAAMYRRPGFEKYLRHWANRRQFDDILTDVYDGELWQTLKESSIQGSAKFFRNEVADSHLGLMLNLDWFQPYNGTIYSIGVIYCAICNLPRDIRFKRENLLTLGLLPGPSEVSLHKINHYLAPIVDELESLWAGISLSRTYECENGKMIRAALILVSCDIPAARKICGHVSALVSCHRCEKRANYENRQHNFAGMEDMGDWFIARDPDQHRQNAYAWRRCNSEASRKRFVKQAGVRWSELLRLPYFNPIRSTIIDPMHCLFLGIARWIMKRIWIEEGILTSNSLSKIQKKMDEFQIPSDLGRIPGKIHAGEGFSNFTADQWRIFFTIYATVSLWDHLSTTDRKILTYFVRICTILVNRILESSLLAEAHQKLVELVKLIEEKYGRDKITPNLHLSLHLCECSADFGPLYAFWCFSFERMNGILGK